MKSQLLQQYFFFGTCVRYLQDATNNYQVGDDENGWGTRTNIEKFFMYIIELSLQVTIHHTSFSRLQKDLNKLESLPDNTFLSTVQASNIREHITSLRETLEAELRGLEAYTITPKRYDIAVLLNNISSLFSPG